MMMMRHGDDDTGNESLPMLMMMMWHGDDDAGKAAANFAD